MALDFCLNSVGLMVIEIGGALRDACRGVLHCHNKVDEKFIVSVSIWISKVSSKIDWCTVGSLRSPWRYFSAKGV